ncbi:MAG: ribonuclease HII [Acidimicrobiales bacterium]
MAGLTAGRVPNLKLERAMFSAGSVAVAGCDEVGRGSLGGPVSVGMVVVDASTRRPPAGLRDSKLLAPPARERLVPRIESWSCCWAIGHASAAEIDAIGILRALRLAGERALASLCVPPDLVLLDGNYDWFTRPERAAASPLALEPEQVTLKVKADLSCASVAAASVIAKVARDRLMVELASSYPSYGWEANKGYAAPEHRAALLEIGPCEQHRRSWHLLLSDGLTAPGDQALEDEELGGGAGCGAVTEVDSGDAQAGACEAEPPVARRLRPAGARH